MEWLVETFFNMPFEDDVFEALNTAPHRPYLQKNHYLTPTQWDAMWEKKLPARTAFRLCGHKLTEEQVERVLAEEKRGSCLAQLFDTVDLSPAQQKHIITTARGSQFIYQVVHSPQFYRPLLMDAARHFRGTERLEWIASNSGHYTTADAVAAYMRCEQPEGYRLIRDIGYFAATLTKVLTTYPDATTTIVAAPLPDSEYRPGLVQLAASRYLTSSDDQRRVQEWSANVEYARLALVSNPVVAIDIVESHTDDPSPKVRSVVSNRLTKRPYSVTDPYEEAPEEHLAWLLARSLPSVHREKGRPWDLPPLAHNPHLSEHNAHRVYTALRLADPRTISVAHANRALTHLEKTFSIQPRPALVETGFWDREGVLYASAASRRSPAWYLDPASRPWSSSDRQRAAATIDESMRHTFSQSIEELLYVHPSSVPAIHAYLTVELPTPESWAMLMQLLPTHHGSLEQLVRAAKILSR